MSEKRKISIRKILQVVLTLVITTGCIVAISSASHIENDKKLTSIDIRIRNEKQYHFIDRQQIMDMIINNRHINVQSLPIGKLDIRSMESIIDANPWVADAQVFVDNMHVMHVNVTQRIPVARIFDNAGNSYYLDTTLAAMPLSANYVYYTTVVTNVPELKDDSISRSLKGQIVSLVRYISRDTFWNAQVSQISIDSNNDFELVPVLGSQKIILGDTSMMQDKFNNLFLFYKKVLDRVGWDKYQVLDLRYKGQVVASPSLPWKKPVDKSMSNMDWVKNIIESGAKDKDEAEPDMGTTATVATGIPAPATVAQPGNAVEKPVKPVIKAAAVAMAIPASIALVKAAAKEAADEQRPSTITKTKNRKKTALKAIQVKKTPVSKLAAQPKVENKKVPAKKTEAKTETKKGTKAPVVKTKAQQKPASHKAIVKTVTPQHKAITTTKKSAVKKTDNKKTVAKKKVVEAKNGKTKKEESKKEKQRVPKYLYQ